ncbi:MAG: 23S rRNA (pseudouridine(1915)-N(3))-methyltransferase RlmH [Anaerobutyricum soehngenii]
MTFPHQMMRLVLCEQIARAVVNTFPQIAEYLAESILNTFSKI